MALVIHELITNSIKYGALSTLGRSMSPPNRSATEFWLRWRERDGPAVRLPERRGFGSVIVERTVSFDLQGRPKLASLRRL